MTKAEYQRAFTQASRMAMGQTLEAGRNIRREYIKVFAAVAGAIRGGNKLFLEERIRHAFPRKELFDFLMKTVLECRVQAVSLIADINKKYIFDALDKVPGHGLSKDKIAAMLEARIERVKIANSKPQKNAVRNDRSIDRPALMVRTFTGKGFAYTPDRRWEEVRRDFTFKQKYSLSNSVWGAVNDTEEKILDVVWGGISQGRDSKKITADLMAYVQGGPTVIPGRWGKLEPGTREYVRRLGRAGVDYRAIRIVRSEKYRTMQQEAVAEGQNNPACTGEYDWVRAGGRENDECDICQGLADGSPYAMDKVPDYPHPNCMCTVVPRLKDHDEFIQQLRDYVNDADTPGAREIEKWAFENGLSDNIGGGSQPPPQEPPGDSDPDGGGDDEERRLEENIQKTDELSKKEFPNEEFIDANSIYLKYKSKKFTLPKKMENIKVAKSRLRGSKGEIETLVREIRQGSILGKEGLAVNILPKVLDAKGRSIMPDAIVNGMFFEFKTIDGDLDRVAQHFRYSRKQSDNIFMSINNHNISKNDVLFSIRKVLNSPSYTRGTYGMLILHISRTGKVSRFNIRDLK